MRILRYYYPEKGLVDGNLNTGTIHVHVKRFVPGSDVRGVPTVGLCLDRLGERAGAFPLGQHLAPIACLRVAIRRRKVREML